MNRIYDIILTPNIVDAIRKVEEGKGVQLLDLTWQSQSIENRDTSETCLTFTSFKEGTQITFEQPEIKPAPADEEKS